MNATKERTRKMMMEPTPTPRAITHEDRLGTLANEVFDFDASIHLAMTELAQNHTAIRQYNVIRCALDQLKRKAQITQRKIREGEVVSAP
jgi:hypothetical protein